MLRRILATRYVAPLHEGGSLPGIVEGEDLGTYVMKFRGAGQGLKSLVAEVVVGELGRRLDLRVPELVLMDLSAEIGRFEAHQEVQELLTNSIGLNLGIDFLPGSFGYDGVAFKPPAEEAAKILWLDAFTANVDRTWRNPNLLLWHRKLWCIDHGAALIFHHSWAWTPEQFAAQPFDTDDHVLNRVSRKVKAATHEELSAQVTDAMLRKALKLVPDEWVEPTASREDPKDVRALYVDYLTARLANPWAWVPK